MKRKPPSLDTPYAKHRHLLPEEAALWSEEAGEKREARERTPKKQSLTKTPGKSASSLLPQSPVTPPPSVSLQLDSPMRGKIRKGAVAIEATLDLHGHTRATAHGVLQRFIAEAQVRGLRTLLVITGKGRDGERGVLGDWLQRIVRETQLQHYVIACENAAPRHGGSGAWYIRIRKIPVL